MAAFVCHLVANDFKGVEDVFPSVEMNGASAADGVRDGSLSFLRKTVPWLVYYFFAGQSNSDCRRSNGLNSLESDRFAYGGRS